MQQYLNTTISILQQTVTFSKTKNKIGFRLNNMINFHLRKSFYNKFDINYF